MLVAYGPDDQPAVAEAAPLEQLQRWSQDHLLHCPNCRGIVHLRGGPAKRTQLHFAHQKGECAWSTESESVRHMRGKMLLSRWLHAQFPRAHVTLEERLPGPNRIADIFVIHPDGQRQAVEFQCAPLDIAQWQLRHSAYRQAGILDTWIIGNNRIEKQEAFLEAILKNFQEILFLDPLVTPARTWLRWPVSRQHAQKWQETMTGTLKRSSDFALGSWVGRTGYGISLRGTLSAIHLDIHGRLLHPERTALQGRLHVQQMMHDAPLPTASHLLEYFRHTEYEELTRIFVLPLLKSYLLDPDLLRRYNYGRGQSTTPPSSTDISRIHNACQWLLSLTQGKLTIQRLQACLQEIPFVGSYAAFVSYTEILLHLAHSSISPDGKSDN